ncbi:DUF536 domain-containing protein [Fructobacillus tropaeoli]|uniref:Regulator of chromosome segregation-like C-terminal domain-containing protein n=1 Tax=Fructobacillus tropaeoli TaxID=709323 RepID=A0A3F3H649_9LACO|nr:DUF536 domain-containing protein [Fructobacillus tropaeoli]GAP05047.1 hypothetical protein FTRO_0280030 [Fructobacillus tropaeoli]
MQKNNKNQTTKENKRLFMSKTIKELADELGVSKQTIQYHYQHLLANNRQKDSRGFNVVNHTAEREIRSKVAKNLPPKNRQRTDKEVANNQQKTDKEKTSIHADLKMQIEDLKRQRDRLFASKEKEIASKDRQIEKLSQLLDQSQQLQLLTQKKNEQLEHKLEIETTKKPFSKNENKGRKWWPFSKKKEEK